MAEMPKIVLVEADLRDYFAAAALQGLLAGGAGGDNIAPGIGTDVVAKAAYDFADAMLMVREQPTDGH